MSGQTSIEASCPNGGEFYVCQNSRIWFLGCCMSDPCTSEHEGVCPQADLRPTSFSKTSYDLIKPQRCVDPDSEIKWYTCSGTTPPFMGCCKTNPCQNPGICPISKLSAARLSDKPDDHQVFLSSTARLSSTAQPKPSAPSSTRTAATSSPTQTLTDANPSTTPTNTPPDEANKSGGLSTGAIVGIAVGGAVIFLALIVFCIIRFRRNTMWSNTRASNTEVQMMDFVGTPGIAEQISAPTFSPNSTPQMPQYSPLPHTHPYTPPLSHFSPYSSPLHSPYDPLGIKAGISHASHPSQGSQRSGNIYVAHHQGQPPFGVGNPHFAEPFGSPPFASSSVNMGAGYGGSQYSELPVEDQYHRRELQG